MIKGPIQEEDVTTVNIYASNIGALQYIRQTLTDIKLNIQKTKIMTSGHITSQQIDGKTVETVADFTLGGSKITVGGD